MLLRTMQHSPLASMSPEMVDTDCCHDRRNIPSSFINRLGDKITIVFVQVQYRYVTEFTTATALKRLWYEFITRKFGLIHNTFGRS